MERLTRKLKKGGYSANRHSEAQLTERLDQLKGVHKQWVGDVSDMITGMKQSEAAGQEGALTLMMLQAGYAAIVRIGRRFESVCPPVEGSGDDTATALGKLEDLYEQCVSELEDVKEGLEECRENGFTDDLAYDELMVTKLGTGSSGLCSAFCSGLWCGIRCSIRPALQSVQFITKLCGSFKLKLHGGMLHLFGQQSNLFGFFVLVHSRSSIFNRA